MTSCKEGLLALHKPLLLHGYHPPAFDLSNCLKEDLLNYHYYSSSGSCHSVATILPHDPDPPCC